MQPGEHERPSADRKRRKVIGGIMLLSTLAAVAVTWTVKGTWVFVGCAVFLLIVAFVVPLIFGRRHG